MNTDRDLEEYTRRLCAALKADPRTPSAIATAAGVPPATVWRLMAGQVRGPKVKTHLALCGALGVHPQTFFRGLGGRS